MKSAAQSYYAGRRGNCAQAVAAAWIAVTGLETVSVAELSAYGRGKAPGGLCGAVYAARLCAPEHGETILSAFASRTAGHVSCRAIRENRAADCVNCVGFAAEILEKTAGIGTGDII